MHRRVYRRKYLGLMVAGTWLGAFGSLIQTWRGKWGSFGLDTRIGSCTILRDKNSKYLVIHHATVRCVPLSTSTRVAAQQNSKIIDSHSICFWHDIDTSPKEFLFIMAFVVPCISIFVCYARIFYIVRKTAMRSHDSAGTLGNNTAMHIQSATTNGNGNSQQTTKKLFVSNNNRKPSDGTDVQLLPKESNGSITPNANGRRCGNGKSLLDSDMSSTVSHSHSHNDLKSSLKFIDTSVDSDFPPTLSALRKHTLDEKKLSGADRISSNVSICRTVEFIDGNGDRRTSFDRDCSVKTMVHDNDSAVEESTSSADNNQVNTRCNFRVKCNSNQYFLSSSSTTFKGLPHKKW